MVYTKLLRRCCTVSNIIFTSHAEMGYACVSIVYIQTKEI
mgnify:CR=1 FL=1